MKPIKKIAIILVVGAIFVLISASFTSKDINDRAIILALGVDYQDDNYKITAEIVSASSKEGQSAFTKLITAQGETIAQAVNDIYGQTGQLGSLGQCQVLLIGDSLYQSNNMQHVLSYFSISDEYKDSSSLCCTQGSAEDIMKTQLPLGSSISLTLVQLLKDAGNVMAVPSTTISKFIQSTLQLSKSAFITLISIKNQPDEPNMTENSALKQVTYICDRMVQFVDYQCVGILDSYDSIGFTLLDRETTGQMYKVEDDNANDYHPKNIAISVTSKSVDMSFSQEQDVITFDITVDVGVKAIRYTDFGKDGVLHPLVSYTLSDSILEQAQKLISNQVSSYLDAQQRNNCDCIGLYKQLEIKQGSKWEQLATKVKLSDMKFNVTVNCQED